MGQVATNRNKGEMGQAEQIEIRERWDKWQQIEMRDRWDKWQQIEIRDRILNNFLYFN
jgi:hypothetical protein